MNKRIVLLVLVSIGFIKSIVAQAVENQTWGNNLIGFTFDARQGKSSITDKRTNKVCIENATFGINKYSSTDGYAYSSSSQNIHDELGTGKNITIEGKKQGQPSLILEVFIYDGNGAIGLNMGIENWSYYF